MMVVSSLPGAVQPSAVDGLVGHAFQQPFVKPRFTVGRYDHVRLERVAVLHLKHAERTTINFTVTLNNASD